MKKHKILILFSIFFCLNVMAQQKQIVFTNKANHLKTIFKLPHSALIQLKDDAPDLLSRIIIDSLEQDTIYLSNPKDLSETLHINVSTIQYLNLPNYTILNGLKLLSTIFFTAGSLALYTQTPGGIRQDQYIGKYIAATFYAGLAFTINFSGPQRHFIIEDYYVKNTYR